MNRLKELRQRKNLTFKELSKKLQEDGIRISSDSLAKYERGDREPKIDKWQALANFFDVTVPYLQGIDDVNSASFRDGFSDIKSLTGDSLKVVYQMETIFMQFEREWKSINEIFKAVLMFGQIMMIKPFESHNEDFALLLMLCMLESSGYILPSFDSDMCDEINAALTLALRRGSYQDLARIVERSLIKSYHTIHV